MVRGLRIVHAQTIQQDQRLTEAGAADAEIRLHSIRGALPKIYGRGELQIFGPMPIEAGGFEGVDYRNRPVDTVDRHRLKDTCYHNGFACGSDLPLGTAGRSFFVLGAIRLVGSLNGYENSHYENNIEAAGPNCLQTASSAMALHCILKKRRGGECQKNNFDNKIFFLIKR